MIRTTLFAAAVLSIALGASMPAMATDLGYDLGSTPVLVLPALNSGTRSRLHLEVPTFTSTAGEVFCSWSLTGYAQPAQPAVSAQNAGGVAVLAVPARPALTPFGSGSFMVEPEHPIDYAPGAIPTGSDLWCVGYPGNNPTIPFTVDVIQSGL